MSFTQDFRTQRRNYSDGETRIGEKDRLWYDSSTNSIRIGDGETPGGVIVGGSGGGSDYVLPTASSTTKGGVKIGSNITITDGVISVAAPFSGSYTDLTNKPTLFDGAYASLSGKPTLFSGSYNDLTDKPTIPSLTGYATESFVTTRGYLTSIGNGTITNAMLEGNIANAKLLNSTVTIGSTVVALGTITANLAGLNSVTATNFIGNATTVTNGVYTNSIGAVTDIMLAGNIANNKLANSSITVNGTSISLGSSATITAAAGTLTGTTLNSSVVSSSLTSVGTLTNLTVTNTITGSVSGNAGTVTNGVYTTGTYDNPSWITGLAYSKLSGAPTIPSLTGYATETYVTTRGYLTSYTETDPVFAASSAAGITSTDISNWGTAYGWGDHSTAGYLTTVDQIVKVADTFGAEDPFKAEVVADTTYGITIETWTGLPQFATSNSWEFGYDGTMTFPDSTVQTTAYTATAAKGLFSVTTNSASGNGSLSYSNGVFTFTPASVPTTVTVNGTSITLGSSGTVTAAAGTLTGTTLNSTVVSSSLTSVGTLTNLSVTNTITGSVSGNAGTATKLATARAINGVDFDGSAAITVTAAAGTLTGTTLASGVTASSLTSVGTLTGVTSNAATAFIAGDAAISGVALQMPREGALRNTYNGANNNMYFDVSTGGSSQGIFQFRSSNAFTNVLTMSPTAFNVNPDAVVTARTPSFGRTAWNAAIDTELTIDDYRFRVSNQGGIFPQVISNVSGQTKNSAWTVVATRSGSAIAQGGSTGTLVPNNAWTTLYSFAGMDSAGDTYVATLQDKNQGRIYRVTFMRSDNGSTTGYNIIAERLL